MRHFICNLFWFEIVTLKDVFEKPVNVKITQKEDWVVIGEIIKVEEIQVFSEKEKEIINKLKSLEKMKKK